MDQNGLFWSIFRVFLNLWFVKPMVFMRVTTKTTRTAKNEELSAGFEGITETKKNAKTTGIQGASHRFRSTRIFQRTPNPQPNLHSPVIPSERVQIWVCLFLYGWYYPGVGLQIWVCLICVISTYPNGPKRAWATSLVGVWSSLIILVWRGLFWSI